jgi:hypothetical protein
MGIVNAVLGNGRFLLYSEREQRGDLMLIRSFR